MQGTVFDLHQHHIPVGKTKATFACKDAACPACAVGVKSKRRANVSLLGDSHLSLSVVHDSVTVILVQRRKKAAPRKRPKRIARKIKKRRGWLTYGGPAELVADGMFNVMLDFGGDAGKALNRIVLERFNNRPDVVAMRELMLADGVPRRERQKAYRALRRLTPVTHDDIARVVQPLVVHDSIAIDWSAKP